MKKLILSLVLVASIGVANAQETKTNCHETCKTKNGTPILPVAGEWSLGFDAVPVLNYFGNLLNSGENSASIDFQQANTIVGSYMKTDNTAYTGKLGIGFTNKDESGESAYNVTLGAGLQKFRGTTRLRGYYGAGVELGTGAFKTVSTDSIGTSTTVDNSSLSFGVRGNVGVQYFFAPKMSVGAEYGWGPSYTSTKVGDASDSNFSVGVDNAGGSIYLSLYF
jgi:hypothetical protein